MSSSARLLKDFNHSRFHNLLKLLIADLEAKMLTPDWNCFQMIGAISMIGSTIWIDKSDAEEELHDFYGSPLKSKYPELAIFLVVGATSFDSFKN